MLSSIGVGSSSSKEEEEELAALGREWEDLGSLDRQDSKGMDKGKDSHDSSSSKEEQEQHKGHSG